MPVLGVALGTDTSDAADVEFMAGYPRWRCGERHFGPAADEPSFIFSARYMERVGRIPGYMN